MLWVYSHYKDFYSSSAGVDFRRQILTSWVDPRTVNESRLNFNDGIVDTVREIN